MKDASMQRWRQALALKGERKGKAGRTIGVPSSHKAALRVATLSVAARHVLLTVGFTLSLGKSMNWGQSQRDKRSAPKVCCAGVVTSYC